MLVRLLEADFEKFVPQAYQMALNPEITGYPAYFDGIKTKEDFVERAAKAFTRDNEEILLFYHDEVFCGWIHYYYLAEDRYLDTASLSAQREMEQMLDEFLEYVGTKYPEAVLYLGFPEENSTALTHLQKRGFVVSEQSWNMKLPLASAVPEAPQYGSVVAINEENFALFEAIHAQRDGEMYWDSRHISDDLAEWFVFVILRNEQPVGAIYSMRDKEISDIFGVDFSDGRYDPELQADLLRAAIQAHKADGSEYLVCFCDDREKQAACDAGFSCVGKYIMVKRKTTG